MDWVDMVERERENHEEMLERINDIVVCTCDICGKELHHGEEAYQISDEDICICENCYDSERAKERNKDVKCKICGEPYWEEKDGEPYGTDMIKVYKEYYCEDCFEPVELCADEDEINSIKYHINYDEE
jgi:hypothetical protein